VAIEQLTLPNKTREIALQILDRDPEELDAEKRALLTSESFFAVQLSKDMGIPLTQMLRQMGSRDWTRYRAAAIIEVAQQEIIAAYAKDRERKGGRRRR
jgi:hypothetical protein